MTFPEQEENEILIWRLKSFILAMCVYYSVYYSHCSLVEGRGGRAKWDANSGRHGEVS